MIGKTTPIEAISQSVKEARDYALNSRYDIASTFYVGIKEEISAYLTNVDDDLLKMKLGELLAAVEEELRLVGDIQGEMRALVNPADGVRRDRASSTGASNPPGSTSGQTDYDRRPLPRVNSDMQPRYDQAPAYDQRPAGGDPNYGSGARGGMGGMGDAPDLGYSRHDPPRSAVGKVNERLYGDKDRFGPPADSPPAGPRQGQYQPPARHRPPPPSNAPPPAKRKDKVKPGLPKFENKPQPKRGGASGAAGKNSDGRPRFQPRDGDQELVSCIEADMFEGKLNVTWDDIAGLEEAKSLLEEAVVYPVLMPSFFQGIRRPWRGVLMYGPPGTGKTMLAKAVASECGTTFFNVSNATLTSRWRGDSEKLVRVLFEMARHYAPSTIFIDEIDSLCGQRGSGSEHEASRRSKTELLTQMDGMNTDPGKVVMVLGATNHPWDLDDAMLRRLEKRIHIPLPEFEDRTQLLKICTQKIVVGEDVDFGVICRRLENYSCADISSVARDAAMMTMRRHLKAVSREELKKNGEEISKRAAEQPVMMEDFLVAITNVTSSVKLDQLTRFEKWKTEFSNNM